jgi:acyl carrier protein
VEFAGHASPPENELQRNLVAVWQETLNVGGIGIDHNFFELGGNSLDVVRIVSRVEKDLGTTVPMTMIFERPTIRELEKELTGRDSKALISGAAGTRARSTTKQDRRIRLNPIDNSFQSANSVLPRCSLFVHEYATPDRLDTRTLQRAIAFALDLHPLARAKLVPRHGLARRLYWYMPDADGNVPLATIDCANQDELTRARVELKSTYRLWRRNSVFQFVQCRHPAGTRLFVCSDHAATDRTGVNRFLLSVLRHYLDIPDCPERVEPFSHDELMDVWGSETTEDAIRQFKDTQLVLADRIAREAPFFRRGLTHSTLDLSETESEWLRNESGSIGTSVNRVFELALIDMAKVWNQEHGKRVRCLRLFSTVNMRPAKYYHEVVGNYLFTPVTTYHRSQSYKAWIRDQLSPDNESVRAGLIRAQFEDHRNRTSKLPLPLRRVVDYPRIGIPASPTALVTNIQFTDTDELSEVMGALHLTRTGTRQIRFFGYFPPYVVVTQRDGRYSVRFNHSHFHLDPGASGRILSILRRSLRTVVEV